jgi:dihydroxyacetone kinase-like predicted kinase
LAEIDIKNMHMQTTARTERLSGEPAQSAAVTVCSGAGNQRLVESLGAVCLDGGPFMNPSTAELIAAVEAVPEPEVLLLPNNANVVSAAEEAAKASAKEVRVIPTRSLQAGLGALVAFERGRSSAENEADMRRAAAAVRSGAVTRASRSATIGGIEVEQGQFLGLVESEPVTSGPVLEPVAREVVERLLGEASDVLTVLLGEGVHSADELVAAVRDAHPELEVEVHEGGQAHYPLLFAVE